MNEDVAALHAQVAEDNAGQTAEQTLGIVRTLAQVDTLTGGRLIQVVASQNQPIDQSSCSACAVEVFRIEVETTWSDVTWKKDFFRGHFPFDLPRSYHIKSPSNRTKSYPIPFIFNK